MAVRDLDAIADYIALDNPTAARELVQRVFSHVAQLAARPNMRGERRLRPRVLTARGLRGLRRSR